MDYTNPAKPRGSDSKAYLLIFGIAAAFLLLLLAFTSAGYFFLKQKGFTSQALLGDWGKFMQELERQSTFTTPPSPKTTVKINESTSSGSVSVSVSVESSSNNDSGEGENGNVKDSGQSNENSDSTANTPSSQPENSQPPAQPACVRYKIPEGEFASDKCYTQQDAKKLASLLSKYESAQWELDWLESSIKIVCSNEDFFGDECANRKEDKFELEVEIVALRSEIRSIIDRGR